MCDHECILLSLVGIWRSACQCRRCQERCGFNPWVRKIPWSREWEPAPVFLPGKSHGQRSVAGCIHGVAESDMNEWLSSSSNTQGRQHCLSYNSWVVFLLSSAVRRLLWGWPRAGWRDQPAPLKLGRRAFLEGLVQLWQRGNLEEVCGEDAWPKGPSTRKDRPRKQSSFIPSGLDPVALISPVGWECKVYSSMWIIHS